MGTKPAGEPGSYLRPMIRKDESIMSNVLDDLISSAKSLVDIAGKKTDNVVEISKLKYQSVQMSAELKSLYEKLGNAVYTMVKSDFDNKELMDSLIEEIDSLKAKIDDVNFQIAQRKNIRICPACGSRNEKDACYCSKCGNKFTAPAEEAPTEEAPAAEEKAPEAAAEAPAETPAEETSSEE